MKKQASVILLVVSVIVLLSAAVGGSFFWGFRLGEEFPQTIYIKGVAGIDPKEPIAGDFSTFWQAWDIINTNYLKNQSTTNEAKIRGAIRGLVNSLDDPYSEFFDPEENKKFQQDIQGNFGGIGAEIGMREKQLVIVAPLKNTPASNAGLRPGDKILKIDASSTEGLTVEQAVKLIRGRENTAVTLTIFRDEWKEPKDFKITRATIVVPTLDFEMKGDLAHVELHSFNTNTNRLFLETAVRMKEQNAKGMVLDLRSNPGGYLNVAATLSGWFFKRGTLVVSEEGNGVHDEIKAEGNEALADFPIVVLINEGSASASEILAGALRDQRKIKLVGEKSFGKGTVQQLENLKDNSSLKITIAHWVLPNGKILEGEGLEPDVPVALTDEDLEAGKDPQLEKALEVLRQEITIASKQ